MKRISTLFIVIGFISALVFITEVFTKMKLSEVLLDNERYTLQDTEAREDINTLDYRVSAIEKGTTREDETFTYSDLSENRVTVLDDCYLQDVRNHIGENIYDVSYKASGSDKIEWYKISVTNAANVNYPVNKTSYWYGSVFTDAQDNLVSIYINQTLPSGSYVNLDVPEGATYFYLFLPPSLLSLKDSLQVTVSYEKADSALSARHGFLPYLSTLSERSKASLNLCAVKYDYSEDKIPFAEGYLFHQIGSDSRKMYYGTRLDNAEEVGEVPFDPKLYVYGISPTDGRVICGRRENKGPLYIWDGTQTYTLFASASRQHYGWLYNTGIDFIKDTSGVEYCIYAEYAHTPSQDGLYVWKGTYPYTNESDWKYVFYQQLVTNDETVGSIRHFHLIRRDPWTNILYLASGDNHNQINWWYSTDLGDNWTKLLNNTDIGWEDHVGRCCTIVFTEDGAYWGSDRDINHCLNSMGRDSTTGVLDPSTRKKLCDLPVGQATNSICYVENPKGLFIFDRIDGYQTTTPYYGNPVKVTFYSLEDHKLKTVCTMEKQYGWGGHRGKCYTNYVSGQENRPAMGFSADTPCIFTFAGASDGIGTLYYELN